jgi:hypothetical protein
MLLAPVSAARVLAYCTLTSAAVAVYLQIREALRERWLAAFGSVVFACWTGMHAPGGWYYHVLAATGCYLWSCWFLIRAAVPGRNRVGWAAAAGAGFAAAVHTHVFLAVFAPLLVFLYWGALPPIADRRWARWGVPMMAAVAGALISTAALAMINRLSGGVWLFFLPQWQLAFRLSQHDPWWLPAREWLANATYLVVPVAMIATGFSSGCRPWKADQRLKGTLVFRPGLALAIASFFQFWTQATTLDYDYMAFVISLHAVPAAVVVLSPAGPNTERRRPAVLAMATAMILGSLLVFMPESLPAYMDQAVNRIGLAGGRLIVPPLLFSLAGVVIARTLPAQVRVVAVALWFSVVNAWTAPEPAAYGFRTPGTRQEMLETFREADDFTHRLDPSLIGIKYWISTENLVTPQGVLQSQQVFDSFVATRAWLTNLFARTSPGLPIEQLTLEHLERATCIGLLSSTGRQAPLADAMTSHYAKLGRPLQLVADQRFERERFGFALTLLRPADGAGQPDSGAPPCMTTDPRIDQDGREKSVSVAEPGSARARRITPRFASTVSSTARLASRVLSAVSSFTSGAVGGS